MNRKAIRGQRSDFSGQRGKWRGTNGGGRFPFISHHPCTLHPVFTLCVALCGAWLGVPGLAATRIADGLDLGGGQATSTSYAVVSSLGGVGEALTAGGLSTNLPGYPGQLFDPAALSVLSTPAAVGGSSTSQLGGVVMLLDGTVTLLSGADVTWGAAAYPLAGISTHGVVTCSPVPTNATGRFFGCYLGAYGTNTLLVYPPSVLNLTASPVGTAILSGGGSYMVGSNATFSATPNAGWQFLGWNDGVKVNPRSLLMPPGGAAYVAILGSPSNIAAAVDATNVNWTLGGHAAWYSQTGVKHGALSAAQSGALGASQISYIQVTTNGPGSLLFWWKVSSAATNCLQFFINTQLVNQISGNVDWNQCVTFLGTSNQVTLTWLYAKNSSAVSGSDAGWVDQVTWIPCPYALNVPQVFYQDPTGMLASWVLNSTGGFRFARILANTGGWALKAAGDVNGDGVSDLLFETAAGDVGGWLMNADGSVRDARFWSNIAGWEVKACGDYEGLHHGQMFFQNTEGVTAYWRLDTNGSFQAAVPLSRAGGWQLRGAGDLDGDGKAELFWQNAAGTVVIWYHNPDGSIRGGVPFNTGHWVLCGVADIDGDGVSDLVWQNSAGQTGGWFMNSNGIARAASYWWGTGSWKLKAAGR